MNRVKLRLTERQHSSLKDHLFPGDGMEAVAIAVCGRASALGTDVLVLHELVLVPHDACRRSPVRVSWQPTVAEGAFRDVEEKGFGILKIHSHPNGLAGFSETDDLSDARFFESVYGWDERDGPHLSGIMLPNGRILARAVSAAGDFLPVDMIEVVGSDVVLWTDSSPDDVSSFAQRHAQLFGEHTTSLLSSLRVAVVGCSGTGSPVIEQMARLGVGELVLVDPDHLEVKNLNRILGATLTDAKQNRMKVDVLAEHVRNMGLGTRVHSFSATLENPDALSAVAVSDFVVGCMDSLSGRHVLGRMARYYVLPYIDVGVKLEALEDSTINQVAGSVHYCQPDGLDLMDRGVFSAGMLEAEELLRTNPEEYKARLQHGYIRGVQVERPAVVSVNMCFASLAVMELLARIHPFRMDDNEDIATFQLSLSHCQIETEPDDLAPDRQRATVGLGNVDPPLDMPSLAAVAPAR